MILDFPTIKYKTVDVENDSEYTYRKTIITRTFWLRIIWMPEQKTIILVRHRINFTYEPSAEHTKEIAQSVQD